MDKKTIVRMCNKLNNDSITLEEISLLLTAYCIEHNKDLAITNQFITVLINTPFVTNCVLIALEYYKKKFNVIELKQDNYVLLIY